MRASASYSRAVSTAREYYNSADADNFYHMIWGGEDIHVGIYLDAEDDIRKASRRTVQRMASKARSVGSNCRILDIGSGYGGAARFLANNFSCKIVALNLSEVENQRHRERNAELGVVDKIDVIDGSFEAIPFADNNFDLVWSQDAILHSGNREQVIKEVARVLKPGGEFIFTDPMQTDDCPDGVLQPILDRIHLQSLGSPRFYTRNGEHFGLIRLEFEDLTPQLINHYSAVLRETQRQEDALLQKVSAEYITRMKKGLQHWIDGGHRGHLCWGILHFRKS